MYTYKLEKMFPDRKENGQMDRMGPMPLFLKPTDRNLTRGSFPNGNSEIKIFHMSDIHYDGKSTEIFESVLGHLLDEGPHYVVITGDIVEGPTEDLSVPVTMIRNVLRDVKRFFGHAPRLRVVPGNHDLFYNGMYGFRRTGKFYELFTEEERGHHFSPDDLITVAAFDSNQILEPRGGFLRKMSQFLRIMSHGLIIERDLDEFSDWARGLKRSIYGSEYRDSFKIALLHHHPMPAKYNFLPRMADEAYMMLENAGVFLYRLIQEDFSLILHGHRHYPQFCRATYYDQNGVEKEIGVLGCGSSGKKADEWIRIVGHNFNVITVRGDGSVSAVQYFKRGTSDFLPGLREIEIKKQDNIRGGGTERRQGAF
ncbi:MAG: metallophosphoesterase [Deltaproteobacteria bacterium]|uniref:Metallophosphoesterase n=1 Tax=Candidatus Zymogenus saltonus TaxID=2844893 RepID=A0A9D8PP46_9DELT|nr:metallophosphoesterase [Candidatus Zymogenus saltonus]